jgi:hypothetical protein
MDGPSQLVLDLVVEVGLYYEWTTSQIALARKLTYNKTLRSIHES